ncbi:MAG: glycerophosphodiester phosphodiesterase family protein [Bacteriovorax sp.]|nr:glycerophosphodiester phosphodiesterase family protein [Bacteriovorax sp.]
MNRPLIIAHRGYSAKYPENTLIAFERAIECKCDMIELDVHLTEDSQLIVAHDYILGRTSNGRGAIDSHSLSDLQKLDCGSWFGKEFSNQLMPSLKEVLIKVDKRVTINVELKHETLKTSAHYQIMAENILSLIEELGYRDLIIISSFNEQILRTLRKQDSTIRLGILDNNPEKHFLIELVREISAYSYHKNHIKLNQGNIQQMHRAGLKVYPFTANTIKSFEKLCSLNVDGIITNQVEDLRKFLKL